MSTLNLALGIDFGTSGLRAAIINCQRQLQWECRRSYPTDQPGLARCWQSALFALLQELPPALRSHLGAIAINGTSATVLLCDRVGTPITEPLLYNDASGSSALPIVRTIAPADNPTLSATSSLTKLLWWHQTLPSKVWSKAVYLLHQADWLAAQLHGQWGFSDYHNSLKLGYDVGALRYPDWMLGQAWSNLLPKVLPPGREIAPITPYIANQFGLPPQCQIVAGTTDSIAAFLASGAQHPGDAVTSLGSTLVVKLLSQTRVDASQYGIYSHRLGNFWLVGGASNTGGAALRQFFDDEALTRLSQQINPDTYIALDYYPLCKPGERFPINDPTLEPRLSPRPQDDVAFLHGLLLGIARIEKQGYDLLAKLGASQLKQLYTAGGGAQNDTWRKIRERCLGVPIKIAAYPEAAMGSAYLALNGLEADL